MAQLVRSRLERGGVPGAAHRERDPLAKVEGIVRDGHLSDDIDEALYGN